MHLKLLQKEQSKKEQKQPVIWLVIKLQKKLQELSQLKQKLWNLMIIKQKKLLKEIYISSAKKQIIDEPRLAREYE